jgi:hypothetical protein
VRGEHLQLALYALAAQQGIAARQGITARQGSTPLPTLHLPNCQRASLESNTSLYQNIDHM